MLKDPIAAKAALLHTFPTLSVLVVGDVMLDQYIKGSCSRISYEAPVPVVQVQSRSCSLGGAGNVGLNLASLGVRVELAGFVGEDPDGERVRQKCDEGGIGRASILHRSTACTTSKTRVMVDGHQLVRIDEEQTDPVSREESARLLAAIRARLANENFTAMILSDYDKGSCTPEFCQELIAACTEAGVPVYVDPKGRDYDKYRGARAIKPNRAETKLIAEAKGWPTDDFVVAGGLLREYLGVEFVLLSLGPKGLTIVEADRTTEYPTLAREVFDVSGAGDTVIATLVAALASEIELDDAVGLANLAAADVVSRVGTTPISTGALLVAIQEHNHAVGLRKFFELEDLLAVISAWRAQGQKVAFTNGCYDLLHAGHVSLLQQAAGFADRLIVGINSDESVTRLKGPTRPLMNESDRGTVLSSLECVDAVVVFPQDTPLKLIEAIRPDVLIKGADYQKQNVVGADFVESYGGELRLIPLVHGLSTSYLAAAIEKL